MKEMKEQFKEAVISSFAKAFSDASDKIYEMLMHKRTLNQQSEEGVQCTVMTLVPKVRIELDNADGFAIESKVIGKSQEVVTGICKVSFDPKQPELNFAGSGKSEPSDGESEAEAPGEEEFFQRVTENTDISEEVLTSYFASSNRWNDYAGWIAAGNTAEAVSIMDDDGRLGEFAQLVAATMSAGK